MSQHQVQAPELHGPTVRVQKNLERFVDTTPAICPERAALITESYKETEALPMALRRAKALEKILAGMSIFIQDGELIVGNQAGKPRSAPIFPEFSCKWVESELDRLEKRTADVFLISEETKRTLRQAFAYWDGKTTNEFAAAMMPPESLEAHNDVVYTVGNYFYNGVGHISVDYARAMGRGLSSVIADAEKALASLDYADAGDLRKRHFLEAVIIANRAVIAFAGRFADLADTMAAQCSDPIRADELAEIARICRKVPAQPPTTFHEALQMIWFYQLGGVIMENPLSLNPGRFDQYM